MRGVATPMRMTITMSIEGVQVSPLNLVKLMHLCSVSLPVGAYSFSQGLEYAIDEGWLTMRCRYASGLKRNCNCAWCMLSCQC